MKLFRRSKPKAVPSFLLSPVEPFQGERLARLVSLVSRKDFSLFLEYLDFTAQEASLKMSSMNLNDKKSLEDAKALQAYMAGLQSVSSIVTYLKTLKED